MRKIEVKKWKVKDQEGKEVEETTLTALSVLVMMKKPEDMPRGFDKFRLFNKLTKAFDKAEKTGTLQLEELEYGFLKNLVDKDVPSIWGLNQNITEALELFMGAPEQ